MPSGRTSSRSSSPGSSRRRWTSTAPSRSRASTCPNEYTLYLSSSDRAQFAAYEGSLVGELQEYLVEHARREGYALLTPPRVLLQTDDDLAMGEFGIATRVSQPEEPRVDRRGAAARSRRGAVPVPAPVVVAPEPPAATMVYRPQVPLSEDDGPPPEVVREEVTLTVDGRVLPVTTGRVVVGRSRECDVRVDDGNVSRRHFELVQEGPTAWVVVRPRLDERDGGQRPPGVRTTTARRRRPDHDRQHRARLRAHPAVSVAVTVDEALLGLKVAFLVLLYLFVWLVVRSATRGLTVGAPQESIILPGVRGGGAPRGGRHLAASRRRPRQPGAPAGHRDRAVEQRASSGAAPRTSSASTRTRPSRAGTRRSTAGRTASGSRTSGSTNGTFVNGARVTSARLLQPGDVIRIGHTDLLVEA